MFLYLFSHIYSQCVYNSLGATLIERDKPIFDEFLKRIAGFPAVADSPEKPASGGQLPNSKPTLYEYFYSREKGGWIAWEWIVPQYVHDPEMKFSEILVPTVDSTRTNKTLALMSEVCASEVLKNVLSL